MSTDQSNAGSPRRKVAIKLADLEELYLLVQGAPYANTLLDAQVTLAQHDLSKTLELVQSGRDRYRQGHARTLRRDGEETSGEGQGSKEAAKLRQQIRRCQLVLEAFDDVIAVLAKMIRLRAGKAPATAQRTPRAGTSAAAAFLTEQFRAEYETAHTPRAQILTIRRYFLVSPIESDADLARDQLCHLQGKEQTYLLIVSGTTAAEEKVPLTLALSGQAMQSMARQKLLELGKTLRLVRLVPRTDPDAATAQDIGDAWPVLAEQEQAGAEVHEHGLIDKGTFTQLVDAAQRSGLVPNADLIAHTRDREFRQKDYQKAFQLIEGLHGKFCAAATLREQRLRREDLDIAAGKIRISPKQLLEKRARDIAENQLVDRARNKFLRVLEGLRVMMRTTG